MEQKNLENILTAATLTGVITPHRKINGEGVQSEFKLVCADGSEYSIALDSKWQETLCWHSWEEVRAVGLVNRANMSLILQKVLPTGNSEENHKDTGLAWWRNKKLKKTALRGIYELILVPAFVMALLGS